MANTLKIKRSAVASKVPTTTDLQLGELAINTFDGKLFLKKDNGTASIVEVGSGGSMVYPGAGIPNSTGSAWGTSYSTTGSGTVVALATTPTFVTNITTPLAIGGTGASSSLTLQSTSGVGTSDSILFKVGNNGATTAMTIDTAGFVGIGTTSPVSKLDVVGVGGNASIQARSEGVTQLNAVRFSNDATSAASILSKRRGTIASPLAVASGDQLGRFTFQAYGGTTNRNIAEVAGFVDTYTSDTDISSYLIFSTSPSGSAAATERMRIRSDGNIGIGGVGNATSSILVSKAITGGTSASGINIGGAVQPTVTAAANYFLTSATTAANGGTPYTIASLIHYGAAQPTGVFNADSTVSNQFGFWTQTNLIGATNNFSFYAADTAAVTTGKTHTAFYSNVNTATGGGTTYGFYAAGTAINYFNGNVGIGTASPQEKLTVSEGNFGVRKTSGLPIILASSAQASGYAPANIQLGRSGAGATATPDNSSIGEIRFDGLDTNNSYANFATIYATIGTNAAGGAPSSLSFATASSGATAAERFRIGAAGQWGIAGANYGTAGQVLVSGGASAAPSWSEVTATSASGTMYENNQTITANYTITTNKNAMSTGPITINSGVTVTIPSGSRWVVL